MLICLPIASCGCFSSTIPSGSGGCGIESCGGRGCLELLHGRGLGDNSLSYWFLVSRCCSGGGSLLNLGLLFLVSLLKLLNITVEEKINGDVPVGSAGDGSTKSENLTGQHPVNKSDGKLTLVIGRDSNIDKLERRVGITKSDNGDVYIRRLLNGLGISSWVSNNQKTGFLELLCDLVSESSWCETSSDRVGSGVVSKLEDGAHTVGTGTDGDNISRVLDGNDNTGGKNNLLPSLSNVEDVNTILTTTPDVLLHGIIRVLGSRVHIGREHHLDVLFLGLKDGR
mmetsp:Transcript_828/g.761  ORF Transcript_828/g.761 Transcript_828/m.761 type:complete len:283 (-) Transcript_828:74-922(-)